MCSPNPNNVIGIELGVRVSLPGQVEHWTAFRVSVIPNIEATGRSTLRDPIGHIVLVGSIKEMFGSYARRVIAFVEGAYRPMPIMDIESHSMRCKGLTVDGENSIAGMVLPCYPKMTITIRSVTGRRINVFEKPIQHLSVNYNIFRVHATHLACILSIQENLQVLWCQWDGAVRSGRRPFYFTANA